MEVHEPDSRYLVLWVCVIITAGIILTGWGVSMKYNFSKINQEMDVNVGQSFEQAEQEVKDVFEDVNKALKEDSKDLNFTDAQVEAIAEIEGTVEVAAQKLLEPKE